MSKVYIGLVHYPVYNKNYDIITTAVTNFDVHDISRTAITYGIKNYFIIHPQRKQVEIVQKILDYWQNGFGSIYNPDRNKALTSTMIVSDIEEVIEKIMQKENKKPVVVITDARIYPNTITYDQARTLATNKKNPLLLLFGTGNGLAKNIIEKFDYILEPIKTETNYNHLCVRSAVAIVLDRILGKKIGKIDNDK